MPVPSLDLTRRRLLGLGLAGGAGAALGALGLPVPARAGWGDAGTPPGLVSMAMHVHASFSEGAASMDAQLDQAQRHGIDVLWWTEHDFRLRATGYRQAVRFEGRSEDEAGVAWTWADATSGPVRGAAGAFVTDQHSPDEAGTALRLEVTGPAATWGALTWTGWAYNHTYTTGIAATTLELDVLAEALGPDAELVLTLGLSLHPAGGGRPAGQYALQYRVGTGGPRGTEDGGLTGVVPVAATGAWQRLTVTPTVDVAALWPDLVAADHALTLLSVGVRGRRGATARAVVDRLRFRRGGRDTAADALALQSGLMAAYAGRYPGVVQQQASELSLVRHLNAFGGRPGLPDYPQAGARKDPSVAAAQAMVAWAHAQGSLVSFNHPLDGVSGPAELAGVLVATRALGADAVEVGCKQDVEQVAWAYDVACRNGVFATATGVSDDHTGQDWSTRRPRWVTSAWAGSPATGSLLGAVAAGRTFFWDLAGWGGAMDLHARGVPAMGGVLVTGDPVVPVEVVATQLPAGGSVDVVVGRVDGAGAGAADLTPAVEVRRVPASQVRGDVIGLDVAPGHYVRAVVRGPSGALVGFSNPVWVLGGEPAGGVPAGRWL